MFGNPSICPKDEEKNHESLKFALRIFTDQQVTSKDFSTLKDSNDREKLGRMLELREHASNFFKELPPPYYNYLLMEASVFKNLTFKDITFNDFYQSIIYVGKSVGSRFKHHFYEAQFTQDTKKTQVLKSLLDNDGVAVVLDHFTYIESESFSNEGAMISLIGIENLLNEYDGSFFGCFRELANELGREKGIASELLEFNFYFDYASMCLIQMYEAFKKVGSLKVYQTRTLDTEEIDIYKKLYFDKN